VVRSPWVLVPLVGAVICDVIMCWTNANDPTAKFWLPPTFFVWPAFAFIGIGVAFCRAGDRPTSEPRGE
jgi:hypothetical protein